MSEEHTQNIPDSRSFEERVFARFDVVDSHLDSVDSRRDAIDLRFDALDSRLQKLETESERRSLEIKPIWERALAQILELRQGFGDFRGEVHDAFHDISRKIGVIGNDMMQLRADQTHVETRLGNLESKP